MAAESERNSSSERAALPFEPKRSRKGDDVAGGKKAEREKADKKKKGKSANAKEAATPSQRKISDKAQARVDAIRESNRKKAAKADRKKDKKRDPDGGSIPEAVSRRMLRRMAILSLSPIALGVGIFFLSYYLLSHQIVEFAPVVVLLTTMGCFGLGVVGLTYGVLSASWDDEPGSLVGLDEFKLNFGRIMDARRATKASKG